MKIASHNHDYMTQIKILISNYIINTKKNQVLKTTIFHFIGKIHKKSCSNSRIVFCLHKNVSQKNTEFRTNIVTAEAFQTISRRMTKYKKDCVFRHCKSLLQTNMVKQSVFFTD